MKVFDPISTHLFMSENSKHRNSTNEREVSWPRQLSYMYNTFCLEESSSEGAIIEPVDKKHWLLLQLQNGSFSFNSLNNKLLSRLSRFTPPHIRPTQWIWSVVSVCVLLLVSVQTWSSHEFQPLISFITQNWGAGRPISYANERTDTGGWPPWSIAGTGKSHFTKIAVFIRAKWVVCWSTTSWSCRSSAIPLLLSPARIVKSKVAFYVQYSIFFLNHCLLW